jgi:hypothetical protein
MLIEINHILPFIKMKKDGKIKTLKDGSGTFLKKDLEKYKNE